MRYGDFDTQTDDSSYDLVILNHVLEHFVNPINELKTILPKIKLGGYLYIEVPGIYSLYGIWGSPLLYFQNAHVYYYFKAFLEELVKAFNLKVIYGDERCTFICQKESEIIPNIKSVYNDSLSQYVEKNAKYLMDCEQKWEKSCYRRHFKGILNRIANILGWQIIRPIIKNN